MKGKDDRLPRIWSPEAERDLFEIWAYIYSHASRQTADKIVRGVHHVCFILGAWPEVGRLRTDIRQGIRSMHVDRYVIFYRVTKTAIEVVRVLDERRDVNTSFEDAI